MITKNEEYYLLFSADIIDSTKKKAMHINQKTSWLPLFKDLYKQFPLIFCKKASNIKVWKFVGDEILFFAKIDDMETAPEYVKYFKESLIEWNSIPNKKKKTYKKIHDHAYLKGAIWSATVPDIDKALKTVIDIDKYNSVIRIDFLGSQIDIGFRIAKNSSLNHIALSVDIAQLCLRNQNIKKDIYYLESKELKGAFEDKIKYPQTFLMIDKNSNPSDRKNNNNMDGYNIQKEIDDFYQKVIDEGYQNTINILFYQNKPKQTPFKFGAQYLTNINMQQINSKSDEELEEIENHISEMKEWFLENYVDPAESCPFESREGGYFYMNGGPYNAEEELYKNFDYPEEERKEAAEQLENEYSVYDWDKRFSPYDND